MRYRLQRHDGTDCSATMVPITVLRMVPIQRYRQKGQYEGTETISTPADEFDCVKVTYSMKVKFFMFSDESQVIEWYAKGVGLVKHEESSRKLGQKMTKTLTKIEN